MQGSGNGSMRGIIPRAMQQGELHLNKSLIMEYEVSYAEMWNVSVGLYKSILESKGWTYYMEVSFVEIYNETIRDLLRSHATDELKHEIKKDLAGNYFISDVTMRAIDPNDTIEIDSIMELAARHRSVGQTVRS